jgi:glutathione synthase/RimK-type ligase-like ATP-grasp enzyme
MVKLQSGRMKLAIHKSSWGFSKDWIAHCESKKIPFKVVDCYKSDIVQDVKDCDAVLWHHHHLLPKDILFARQLLHSLEQAGKKVFPNANTAWHFDDKVGQKYLLEAIDAPLAKSYVFYDKSEALNWVASTSFPKVAKLRGGAGSNNVRLIRSRELAHNYIHRAFGNGFSNYDRWNDLNERIRKLRLGKTNWIDVAKSVRRLFVSTEFARIKGRERGYVYFQDFIEGNEFDIRVVTIGDRAFAIKRMVRAKDFRASGSGFIRYDKNEIDERCVSIAFDVSAKLKAQVVAYDFVFKKGDPLIVEINYGYAHQSYFDCPGYWRSDMSWHAGSFNSADWIIDLIISEIQSNGHQ